MSGRKLNGLEQKIHQAALAASEKVSISYYVARVTFLISNVQKISQREVDSLSSDLTARTSALNFLLGAGLLKVLKGDDGKLQYRGVVKEELDVYVSLHGRSLLMTQTSQEEGLEQRGSPSTQSYPSIRHGRYELKFGLPDAS